MKKCSATSSESVQTVMESTPPRFIVGIDLGTSNSALAFVDIAGLEPHDEPPPVQVMPVEQVVAAGAVEPRPTLPSVVYVRGESELPTGSLNLPWKEDPGYCVGAFAREQGSRIPGRMIHSAKSWLCHPGVDREARILPAGGHEEDARRSPVEVAGLILEHFRASWNHRVAAGDSLLDLARQQIVLCVPASFDAAARSLTMAAARKAGLDHVQLLEEPQAAFHAWIDQSGSGWRKHVRVGDIVLVVDVGGGTTDFSLIAVRDAGGELELRRLAVGEHILLGGDNMDLALAYGVSDRLEKEKGKKLDAMQFAVLVQQCRVAKECLLTHPEDDSHPIVLLGRGSSVIGGTIRTELRREGFEEMMIEGFFPRCKASDRPAPSRRAGFREAGLPYASDPAITLHLAQFLGRQHEAVEEFFPEAARAGRPLLPTALLFNGGVFKAGALRKRIVDVVGSWCREVGQEAPRVLGTPEEDPEAGLDLAVARGAAYLGWAKRGRGVRIRGGSPRTYYVGIESAAPAVPGVPAPLKALCVVPFGMEEGSTAEIRGGDVDLCVWTGEPAVFRFLSSTTRRHDAAGAVCDVGGDDFVEHSPIETVLGVAAAQDKAAAGRAIEADLRSHLTEIGTLELACVERARPENSWKLEFNIRAPGEEGS